MLITFNVLRAFTEKVESLSTHQGKGDAVDAAVAWSHPSYQFSGSSHPPINIFNVTLQIQS